MTKQIAVHNGTFHADEALACALLEVFTKHTYQITRIPHQGTVPTYTDFVLDVGRKYDGKKYFDHHHFESDNPLAKYSSAGLIWKYLDTNNEYPEIDTLVKAVDENDVGIRPATSIEFSHIVSQYNHRDVLSMDQDIQFAKAVDWIVELLGYMVAKQARVNSAKTNCDKAGYWNNNRAVLDLVTWQQDWGKFINGETRPDIEAVVWYDKKLGTYNIQTTNKSSTSYDKVGRKLLSYNKMDFVHSANFFAVCKDRELMNYYIDNYLK